MRKLLLAFFCVLLLALPAHARNISEVDITCTTTDVTLTTTTEGIAVTGGLVTVPRDNAFVCVYAYSQLTTGAATTTVTPRIQRGSAVTGTVVGDATALTIQAAAGDEEQYSHFACEERTNVSAVQYNYSLQQAGASGNGTVLQSCIATFVME